MKREIKPKIESTRSGGTYTMRLLRLAALLSLFALVITGCGGSGGSGSSINTRAGRAVFTIKWPQTTRLVPAASQSIRITIRSGSVVVGTPQLIVKPVTTATFTNLPAGTLTVVANAYPQADGTGVVQASGTTPITIVAGSTTPVGLTLASTIAAVSISPATPTLAAGAKTVIVPTYTDASGNVVLVAPGAISFVSNAPSVATIDATGIVSAVSPGTANITITDTESGKIGFAIVTVPGVPTTTLAPGTILFDSDRGGTAGILNIYTLNASSGAVTKLTGLTSANDGSSGFPVASPDGKHIAFISNRSNAPNSTDDVYIMNADGTGVIDLTNNPASDINPRFTPDGTRIIFASDRGKTAGAYDIYKMNIDGTGVVNLTNSTGNIVNFDPVVSPDGTKIAFASNRNGLADPNNPKPNNFDIITMGLDGSSPQTLISSPGNDRGPSYSPDGTKIAFQTDRDGNPEVYIANSDGTNPVRYTNAPLFDTFPVFTADNATIVFNSSRTGNVQIYSLPVSSPLTTPTRLMNTTSTDENATVFTGK